MSLARLKTGKDYIDNADVIVSKIGGDNAGKFKENFANVSQDRTSGQKRVLVISAIRSSKSKYNQYALTFDFNNAGQKKDGFNTTSHLIEAAKFAQQGNAVEAKRYVSAIREFNLALICDEVESEFQSDLISLLDSKISLLSQEIDEACDLSKNEGKQQFFNLGKDCLYLDQESDYFSFTGFGEILAQELYDCYFTKKGGSTLKTASLKLTPDVSKRIFGEDPNEAFKNEIQKIDELRSMFSGRVKSVMKDNDVGIAGGYLPIIASRRGYSDKTGALLAQVLKADSLEVVYLIEKEYPIMSADPKAKQKRTERRVVKKMTYNMAKELFGPIGADAGAIDADAVTMLSSAEIPAVVMNPADLSRGSTVIRNNYRPKETSVEVVASRLIPSAVEIISSNMISQEGVIAAITDHFKGISIDQIYTTEQRVCITFSGKATEKDVKAVRKFLREKFQAKYKVSLKSNFGIIFCLASKMDVQLEVQRSSFALRAAKIKPEHGTYNQKASVITMVMHKDQLAEAVEVLHDKLIANAESDLAA